MNQDVILSIRDLTISLPDWADRRSAVSGASLTLHANEVLCVVGESGSGKSVMSRAIMGLLPEPLLRVTHGQIAFEGRDMTRLSPAERQKINGNQIGMIFQEPMTSLNPLMKVGRQIDELIELHTRLAPTERRRKIIDMMEEVRLPEPDRVYDSYPHQLSGGQRQRVMIVMAMILGPQILIADEPTTALDVTTQAQILTLIRSMQRSRGTGVIFITHDFGVVAEIADRVAVMRMGELLEIGTVEEVLTAPKHSYTKSLIEAVPALTPPARRPRSEENVVLEAKGLTKTFSKPGGLFRRATKGTPALAEVDLAVRRGEIVGLVGESGSGKSTLARCMVRLVEPDSGQIRLLGQEIANLSRRDMRPLRKQIQMIFQDPYTSLNPRLTVGELISQGPIAHGMAEESALADVQRLLRLVRLEPSAASRYPHEFSGGQRQRIGIARALAMNPSVMIADEAVSALDVSVQETILQLLLEVRREMCIAILFVTHDLRVAAQICDRIAVMNRGRIVESGETVDVFSNPAHDYTKTLLNAVPGRDWDMRRFQTPKQDEQ